MQTKTTYTVNVVKTLSGNQMDLTTLMVDVPETLKKQKGGGARNMKNKPLYSVVIFLRIFCTSYGGCPPPPPPLPPPRDPLQHRFTWFVQIYSHPYFKGGRSRSTHMKLDHF